MSRIYIGTSGYSYSYWKNRFYPEKLPSTRWLNYYSQYFNTLELNHTFYRFPVIKSLRKLDEDTPSSFKVSVKANRLITHYKRMQNVKNKIYEFTDVVREGLRSKLACILFQLPPNYAYSEERLNDILTNLSHLSEYVVEFRHVSWWKEEVYNELKKANLSFCSVSYPALPEDNIMTSNVFYKRMHGVPELFKSAYDSAQLKSLLDAIPEKGECYIYFNNTMFEAGYTNAKEMTDLIKEQETIGECM